MSKFKSKVFSSTKIKRLIEICTTLGSGGMLIYGTVQISTKAAWFVAAAVLVLAEKILVEPDDSI